MSCVTSFHPFLLRPSWCEARTTVARQLLRPTRRTHFASRLRRRLRKQPAIRRMICPAHHPPDSPMPATLRADPLLPTGTITFLFTDIEGSTTLWEQNPDAMHVALARHDALLRHAIESSGGCIVKTMGDGVFAVFGTAADALAACLAAQRALQAPDADTGRPAPTASEARPPIAIKVRMGVHTGVAELRDGDYFGASLSRAARIMSAAHGEQILLSSATAELLRKQLAEGVTLREMGEHRL